MNRNDSCGKRPAGGEQPGTVYQLVLTGDGSHTLYLPAYDEHMHSLSGAYEEALLKHVRPSGLLGKQADRLAVLDIGFGLGYNILALIVSLHEQRYTGGISVISFEKDRALLPALRSICFTDGRDGPYSLVREAYMNGTVRHGQTRVDVKFGDARRSVRSLPSGYFDAVFFDPFSPSRNPELWSVDFFREMSRVMKDDAVLTTYSSALQVRGALIEAGFMVGRGPSVGGKREGTLASKTGAIPPLAAGELSLLRSNVRSVPYRDELLRDEPSAILDRRKREMGVFREQRKGAER